jgi:oxygen-dependent protoporphyrinogen oxidase
MIGVRSTPVLTRVQRWERANPQYEVGHSALVEDVDGILEGHPGLFITGSGLRGVGVPDGVELGREAARQLLEQVRP